MHREAGPSSHHNHEHDHEHGTAEPEKTAALLNYMLEHNIHHAEELHDLTHRLEDEGRNEAAAATGRALELYERGNAELERAARGL